MRGELIRFLRSRNVDSHIDAHLALSDDRNSTTVEPFVQFRPGRFDIEKIGAFS